MAFVLHHPYQMGRKLASSPVVGRCSSIGEVAASVVASTREASVEEACSCLAAVECTLVVGAFLAAAAFVHRLRDLLVLHQVAYWVALLDYRFLGYMVLVITGYTLASGTRLTTVHHPWDLGGPFCRSRH